MGGNALKNTQTRRYEREEYFAVAKKVTDILAKQGIKCEVIRSYEEKESFGDLDVLVLQTPNLKNLVETKFKPNEMVVNDNVISFNVDQLQVDLIQAPEHQYEFSRNYFAYNDLGNLLGRIAHKLGLKLGHDCLKYVLRDGTHVIGNIVVTREWDQALRLLHYDPKRYNEGFKALTDIFEYVLTSKLFDPDIYLLHNRNAESRIRDRKRETYMKFLQYCETIEPPKNKVAVSKQQYLYYLLNDASFRTQYSELIAENNRKKVLRMKFNGDIVGAATGFEGKKLGAFMEFVRKRNDLENMGAADIKLLCVEEMQNFQYVVEANREERQDKKKKQQQEQPELPVEAEQQPTEEPQSSEVKTVVEVETETATENNSSSDEENKQ